MKYHVSIFAPFMFEAVEASLSTSQNFKTANKYNLACIFLSLRSKLKKKQFALGPPVLKVLLPFLLPGNRRASEGTCRGDSGGPLLMDEYMNGEFTTVQTGVLHGSLQSCSNQKYPAIYSRLSQLDTHNWLFSNLFAGSKYF